MSDHRAPATPKASNGAAGLSNANKKQEFKNQLVHDVFGRDNKGRVPMEKVAMLIWQFRDDPAVVQFMAQFVAKVRISFSLLLLLVELLLLMVVNGSTV